MARTPYGKAVGNAKGGSAEGFGRGVAVRPASKKGGPGLATRLGTESQAGRKDNRGLSNRGSGSTAGGKRGADRADIVESPVGKRSRGGKGNVQVGGGKVGKARRNG